MTGIKKFITTLISKPIPSQKLAFFRIIFGLICFFTFLRFLLNNWVEEFYINPKFYFPFFELDFIRPLPGNLMYIPLILLLISSLFIAIGFLYRFSAIILFINFLYIELIDKSLYLNHYYFLLIIAFLMIFNDSGKVFSLDNRLNSRKSIDYHPAWQINILIFQISLVYFFAGFAKLNYDWLFNAMPLKLWLPANSNLPIIGELFKYEAVAYIFSWIGTIYDLTIWIFLLNNKTRKVAYLFVIIFHSFTFLLFQIGIFPLVMTLFTLIFFLDDFFIKVLKLIGYKSLNNSHGYRIFKIRPIWYYLLALFVTFQLFLPLRYLQNDGNLFWNEKAYRFGWRVMLMEKAGYCNFYVKFKDKNGFYIDSSDYLTEIQSTQMATQPDMILQFSKYLRKDLENKGYRDFELSADSYVTLNGKKSRRLINPNIDISRVNYNSPNWILEID